MLNLSLWSLQGFLTWVEHHGNTDCVGIHADLWNTIYMYFFFYFCKAVQINNVIIETELQEKPLWIFLFFMSGSNTKGAKVIDVIDGVKRHWWLMSALS